MPKDFFFPFYFFFFHQMFRKAKRISQRLGLNKDKCTVSGPVNKKDTTTHDYSTVKSSTENQQPAPEQTPPFVVKIDQVISNTGSDDDDDDDSVSTKSTESEDLKSSPKQDRPGLSKCLTAPEKPNLYDTPENSLERQLSMMDTGNLELLLSMETQARMDAQAEREKEQQLQQQQDNMLTPRPTRIKFELPVTPPRSRSPARLAYPRARPIRSLPDEGLTANAMRHPVPSNKPRRAGWRHLFSDRDEDESKSIPLPIAIGSKVRLKMRPLPTFGHVRFIGAVEFSKGEWIGVELDHGGMFFCTY
jgi:hypothetical protein